MAALVSSINYLLPSTSLICDFSSRFAGIKHSKEAALIYQVAEPLLIYIESKSSHFHTVSNKIKNTFLPAFLRSDALLDRFFIAANLTSIVWTFGKLGQLVDQHTKFGLLTFWKSRNITPLQFGLSLIPIVIVMIGISTIALRGAKAGNAILNRENPEELYKQKYGELPDNTTIQRKYPFKQNFLNSLHLFRLAMTIALTIFSKPSKEKLFWGINAACEILSWIQIAGRRWYVVKRKYDNPENNFPSIKSYVYKFTIQVYQFWKNKEIIYPCTTPSMTIKNGSSVACQELNADMNLCTEHFAHITCIFDSTIKNIEYIKSIVRVQVAKKGTARRPQSINLDFSCPQCHQTPFHQELTQKVVDKEYTKTYVLWNPAE